MPTNGLRSGAYPLIQSAFYAEHRARLAILKIAVDHECAVETGKIAVPKIASGTFDYADLGYWILPSSFKAGLDESKSHKHFKRYPLFWQVFLWGFGSFYLKDRRPRICETRRNASSARARGHHGATLANERVSCRLAARRRLSPKRISNTSAKSFTASRRMRRYRCSAPGHLYPSS